MVHIIFILKIDVNFEGLKVHLLNFLKKNRKLTEFLDFHAVTMCGRSLPLVEWGVFKSTFRFCCAEKLKKIRNFFLAVLSTANGFTHCLCVPLLGVAAPTGLILLTARDFKSHSSNVGLARCYILDQISELKSMVPRSTALTFANS
jgi:hypothetical protein